MAPSPARSQIVRPVADYGIADGIEQQGNEDREPHQPRIEPDNLTVKYQQEKFKLSLCSYLDLSVRTGDESTPTCEFNIWGIFPHYFWNASIMFVSILKRAECSARWKC